MRLTSIEFELPGCDSLQTSEIRECLESDSNLDRWEDWVGQQNTAWVSEHYSYCTVGNILVQALNGLLHFASFSALGDRGTRGGPLPMSQPHHLLHMLLHQRTFLTTQSTMKISALHMLPCMLVMVIIVRH